jgi:nitrogen-specific signal transduction histidine kinase
MLYVTAEYAGSCPALEHFDPARLFDTLSTGIIVLDEHLCAIYANIVAQRICAFSLKSARGRPFEEVVDHANGLALALRQVLATGGRMAPLPAIWRAAPPSRPGALQVTATVMAGEITGTHLLLEVNAEASRFRHVS